MVNLGMAGGAAVTIIISAVDKFSQTFKKATIATKDLGVELVMVGAALTAVGVAGIFAGKKLLTAATDFEKTEIAFTTLLGSAEEAKLFLEELAQFAAKTPFSLIGVEKAAKQLMAVGFEAEEVMPVLKSVGDIAAGLGLQQDGLQRLILNLGQVKTLGRATNREMIDFARAGIPIYEALADQMGVARGEIQDMVTAGKIGSDDVIAAFKKMTSAGGKFANMMDKMAKTTGGRMQELGDQIEILERKLGKELLPIASDVTEFDCLTVIAEEYDVPHINGIYDWEIKNNII